jgi:hypothetical protein
MKSAILNVFIGFFGFDYNQLIEIRELALFGKEHHRSQVLVNF